METEEPAWSKVDLQKLLHAMRESIPKSDRISVYTQGQRRLDWEKVAFHPYSSEACRNKWEEISQKMRKIRTLTELVDEAEGAIENPFKNKNYKIHPEFPKRPNPPNSMFYQENKATFEKRHPDLSTQELMKLASDKYKELPEHKKAKYIKKFQCAIKEYEQRMQQLRKQYPKVERIRRPCLRDGETLLTPRALWYRHERKKLLKANPDAQGDCIRQSIEQNGGWRKLSDKQKLQWINCSLEQEKEHEEREREQHLEGEPTSSVQQKPLLNSSERLLKFRAEGLPHKPPINGFNLFCKEQRTSLKGIPNTEYMVICGQRWRLMTEKQKDEYNTLCREMKEEYKAKLSRYMSTLPEEQQQILAQCDKRKNKPTKGSSSTARAKRKFPGEPKIPYKSGNVVFCSEQMARLKSQIPGTRDRMAKISPMWRTLSAAEKKHYKEMAEHNAKRYAVELQKWFSTLSADEQADYWEQNPKKHQFLDEIKEKSKVKRRKGKISTQEARKERPSDSEDEDSEDTTSEEEDSVSDMDDEEEEDEDGMTFGTMDMDIEDLNGNLTDTSSSELDSDVEGWSVSGS